MTTQPAAISATPTKLNTGAWGAKVQGRVTAGQSVRITTRSGKSWDATVERVVWTDGSVSIVSTKSAGSKAAGISRTNRPSSYGRRTGCSCGSRVDKYGDLIPSPRNCWTCRHDG